MRDPIRPPWGLLKLPLAYVIMVRHLGNLRKKWWNPLDVGQSCHNQVAPEHKASVWNERVKGISRDWVPFLVEESWNGQGSLVRCVPQLHPVKLARVNQPLHHLPLPGHAHPSFLGIRGARSVCPAHLVWSVTPFGLRWIRVHVHPTSHKKADVIRAVCQRLIAEFS